MRRRAFNLLVVGLFVLAFATPVPANLMDGDTARCEFDAYLDDKSVGKHSFEVVDNDGVYRAGNCLLESVAKGSNIIGYELS